MMLQDARLAFRSLRATPIVTTVAILSLALGIGANTAVFSLVDRLLLRTLPIIDPERLVLLSTGPGDDHQQYSDLTVDQVRRSATSFDGVCAWALPGKGRLAVSGDILVVDRQFVSGDYSATLGVRATVGRLITPTDDAAGGGPDGVVAVISYAFWQSQLAGSPRVVGSHVLFERVPVTIIGVTPPAFQGVIVGRSFDVAVPIRAQPLLMPSTPYTEDGPWLRIMLRLKHGQSLQKATAAIRAAQPAIRAGSMGVSTGASETFMKEPFRLDFVGTGVSPLRDRFARPLLVLLAVVGLVLVIACGNIANLLLARGAARRHEMAVRLALGASRWRLARQLLVESVLMAAIGSAIALIVAVWVGQGIIGQLSTFMMPIAMPMSTDWRMLGFTALTMVITTLLFGLVPAWQAGGAAPASVVQAADRQRGDRAGDGRLSGALVVLQVALSLTLIVTAALLVRSFERLAGAPLGFEADRAIAVTLGAPSVPARDRHALYERLIAAVRAVPGVSHAGGSMNPPIAGTLIGNFVVSEPGVAAPPEAEPFSQSDQITSGFIAAYGMTLQAGRDFDDRDTAHGRPVMIVNEAFLRRFVPGDSPVGRVVDLTYRMPMQPDFSLGSKTIVGVVRDSVFRSMRERGRPTIYLPFTQMAGPILHSDFYIVARARAGSPALLMRPVSNAILAVSRDLTVTMRPVAEQVDAALAQDRLVASLATFFGALAVLLAALGLYGVTAYSVARRRAEIGVRMALGAAPARIIRLVLVRVSWLIIVGVSVGLALSLWASTMMASLLYGLGPRDPMTLVAAAALLCGVGVGGWLASRVSRVSHRSGRDPARELNRPDLRRECWCLTGGLVGYHE
jgi:predicted permease